MIGAIFLHGMVGGATSVAQGGEFLTGFAGSAVGKMVTLGGNSEWGKKISPGRFFTATLSGGLASVAGGGKFADGAQSAAMGYIFNHMAHFSASAKLPFWASEILGLEGKGVSVGIAISWPGDVGGEWDLGFISEGHVGGMDVGTGRLSLDVGYDNAPSLRSMDGSEGTTAGFNYKVGGLDLSFDKNNNMTGGGAHIGFGVNAGYSGTITGTVTVRDAVNRFVK